MVGECLYTFEGDPEGSHSQRRVVKIKNLRPLAKKQQAAGIPELFRGALLSTWDDQQANPGTREMVREFLDSPNRSIYLSGRVGTGKTWAACVIGNEFLDHDRAIRFQHVPRLLLDLRATFTSNTTSELEILAPLFDTELLILDELGDSVLEGNPRASHFASSRILTVIEERSQARKPTVMTSNLSLAELVRWSGDERIGSRIRGACGERGIIELVGRDLRFDPQWEEALVQ
jgi:DNA replication protein DnaC